MKSLVARSEETLIDQDRLSDGIRRALDFVHQHFRRSISVLEVANHSSLSYHHLCRKFKKETGVTVVELINRLRIDLAKKILATEPDPITEVARKVGFTSTVQFHRTFKKLENDTPMQYRKKAFGEG